MPSRVVLVNDVDEVIIVGRFHEVHHSIFISTIPDLARFGCDQASRNGIDRPYRTQITMIGNFSSFFG
jgi:hypothetical protein